MKRFDEDNLHFPVPSSPTVKPRVPTIISVQQSNANFQVKWKSNMESTVVDNELEANVTYYKKGETRMVGAVPGVNMKDVHACH